MELSVENLFIKPVVLSKTLYTFTEEELNYIKNDIRVQANVGNTVSISNNVIEESNGKLDNIKKFIELGLKFYVKNIIAPLSDNIEFYISNSWTNYTKKMNHHHKHLHNNSLISGCLYIDADPTCNSIAFFNEGYSSVLIESEQQNPYNSQSWNVPVKTGQLILFNSSMVHGVPPSDFEGTRISLAFNVFVKGDIGKDTLWKGHRI